MKTAFQYASDNKSTMQGLLDHDRGTIENIAAMLRYEGENNLNMQCGTAVALLDIRDNRLGVTVDLAHEIVQRQLDNIVNISHPRPLSEKQIGVIVAAAWKARQPIVLTEAQKEERRWASFYEGPGPSCP